MRFIGQAAKTALRILGKDTSRKAARASIVKFSEEATHFAKVVTLTVAGKPVYLKFVSYLHKDHLGNLNSVGDGEFYGALYENDTGPEYVTPDGEIFYKI